MGTKHTSRGPNRRRRKVSAVRTFPPGCSPPVRDPPESPDSGSGPDEEIPPVERGPVSDGTASSKPSKGGSDVTEASGAGERSLLERRDLDSRKNLASAIRIFPPGCGANGSSKEKHLQSAAGSKARNLDGEPIEKPESEAKSHELNNTQIRAQGATVKSATDDDAPGPMYNKTSDADRKKPSLLEHQSQFGKKAEDNRKRKLPEDPDQGALDIKKQTHGDSSSQAPGKIVIVLGLMAAQNCPWRNGKRSRVSKPQLVPRTKAK